MDILRNETILNTTSSLLLSVEHKVNSPITLCHYQRNLHDNPQPYLKLVLVVLFSVSGVFGLFSNIVVVFAIHKTNQLAIQPIKLFRVLSFISIFNSLTTLFRIKGLLHPYQSSCLYYHILNFAFFIGVYNSFFIIVVVALDRFLHITYLQNYSSVFTATRFKLSIAATLLLALYQGSATVISLMINGPDAGAKYTFHLNVVIAASIIFFYTASLVLLRRRNRFIANVSFTQRRILRITSTYFYFYLVNMLALLTYQILLNWTNVFSRLGKM